MKYNTAPLNAVIHQMDSALTLASAVTENALDGAGKMFDVQLRAARASLADLTGSMPPLSSQTQAMDWILSSAKQGQAAWAKVFSYGNEMATILGLMHGKLAIITENGTIQSHKKFIALMGEADQPTHAGASSAPIELAPALPG